MIKKDERFFLVGGAGFIGAHFAEALLTSSNTGKVTIYDNFSSGRYWHLERIKDDPRLSIIENDAKKHDALQEAMGSHGGHHTVIHLASNPDIAKAATQPDIDFWEGSYLTNNVLEAMRQTNTKTILYASGSGVYGDLGDHEAHEDHGPLIPVSTYGASKLFGESLIASYCHMFDLTGRAFRFGNVVGPRQTHGVGYDFVRRLMAQPHRLHCLGDGNQSKSYIHVSDVISAVMLAHRKEPANFQTFNVATGDYIAVNEIANVVFEVMGLNDVDITHTGGNRGWKGDVPIVRLNTDRIQALGWSCKRTCGEAIRDSVVSILADINDGRIPKGQIE